jgi:ribosomal protein S18 acetylase RimI-like enzyme
MTTYTHRLATPEDAAEIAPLAIEFAKEREAVDPSMQIKSNFDFQHYVTLQLSKPNAFCWVLEHHPDEETQSIVGIFFTYAYDEAPPPNLPDDLKQYHELENPFIPRRVGSVLGLYIQPEHRHVRAMKPLIDTAIAHIETLKITDIDLLVSAEQTGIHALLDRLGFTKAAVQYTRHYKQSNEVELPNLHPPHPELPQIELPEPKALPLRHTKTHQLVRNPQGDLVFLMPLKDEFGKLITTSSQLPIYGCPLCHPQTQEWVFDDAGNLVMCPILEDENGEFFEVDGIVQFQQPVYQNRAGKVMLGRDVAGNYLFRDAERDAGGKILRSLSGHPIF